MNAGQNLLGIVQFSSPALPECDAARAVVLGAFEQEVKRLCAEDLTPHGLMLLYTENPPTAVALTFLRRFGIEFTA